MATLTGRLLGSASSSFRRETRTMSTFVGLAFRSHGSPRDVLAPRSFPRLGDIGRDAVRCDVIASSVNPADVNTVEGVYPLRPAPREGGFSIGGNEGVMRVTEVGSDVRGVRVGDVCVPKNAPNLGLWAEEVIAPSTAVQVVVEGDRASAIPLEKLRDLSCLSVCFMTAERLLRDFGDLREGDFVIQNGATSAVGQAVIQLCRERRLRSINMVRDVAKSSDYLKALGGDIVTDVRNVKEVCRELGIQAKVAFNCVGGESSSALAKRLEAGGTMVTYGGMSKQPVVCPTPLMIFKNIKSVGFWLSGRDGSKCSATETEATTSYLVEKVLEGKLGVRTSIVPFSKAMTAFTEQHEGKVVFDMAQ